MTVLASPNAEHPPDVSQLADDELASLLNHERMPRHIGIVMDGNGRWANKRGLSRIEGHRAGVDSVWRVIDECGRLHIEAITLYAFSSENWKRPPQEVQALMRLFREQLRKNTPDMHRNNVRLRGVGDIERLPLFVRWELARATKRLSRNTGLVFNLAVSYGGRQEIIQAAQRLATDVRDGKLQPDEITEERFSNYLYTASLPDPDLIIRTSGEMRLSNFLLWQSAYAEFIFTPTLWPDFDRRDLHEAILRFQQRDRRYGGVNGSPV